MKFFAQSDKYIEKCATYYYRRFPKTGNRVVSTNVQFSGHFDLVLITACEQHTPTNIIDVIVALDCRNWCK